MKKITVKIGGMACGMCEAHICDVVRKVCPNTKKLKASRIRGEATFLAEEAPDTEKLKKAIEETGYIFISASSEEYKKRSLFG